MFYFGDTGLNLAGILWDTGRIQKACLDEGRGVGRGTPLTPGAMCVYLLLVLVGWWAEKQSFNCPYRSSACQAGSWMCSLMCVHDIFRKTVPLWYYDSGGARPVSEKNDFFSLEMAFLWILSSLFENLGTVCISVPHSLPLSPWLMPMFGGQVRPVQ